MGRHWPCQTSIRLHARILSSCDDRNEESLEPCTRLGVKDWCVATGYRGPRPTDADYASGPGARL